jgi:hypothetical protein
VICAIDGCNRPVAAGSPICAGPSHQTWYRTWKSRFGRLSFPGVQRVLRRNEALRASEPEGARPTINVSLPAIGETPGINVKHTLRAGKVYCILTVQWACGCPIGWGKCYSSESSPQVIAILNSIWEGNLAYRPAFLAYDNACNLLRHVLHQNRAVDWFRSTRFIVDAWHYIGHKASDGLCRTWCNPAPADGSQPDLLRVSEDSQGQKHLTRAFNTETAEQFNSWLDGFESQTQSMTDVMFDFFIHGLMLLYYELSVSKIQKQNAALPEDFFDAVYDPNAPAG